MSNHSGIFHGEFISTSLDAAGTLPGIFYEHGALARKKPTLSLNIIFLSQAQTSRIKAVGKLISSGRKIYFGVFKVYDMEDNLIASGHGLFRYTQAAKPEMDERGEVIKYSIGLRLTIDV
ncbi:PaaI family thioesterase [Desulfocastanea catecholica]